MLAQLTLAFLAGYVAAESYSQEQAFCHCYHDNFKPVLSKYYETFHPCLLEAEVRSEQWDQCKTNDQIPVPVKLFDFAENTENYRYEVEKYCIENNEALVGADQATLADMKQVLNEAALMLKQCVDAKIMTDAVIEGV